MSGNGFDPEDLIAMAQRNQALNKQQEILAELKKQNSRAQKVASAPAEKTYKCPACAEWIKAEAKICKFCRTDVSKEFAAKLAKEKRLQQEREKRLAEERAEQESRDAAEKKRLDDINAVYEKQRLAKRAEHERRKKQFQKFARSKTGIGFISAILCLIMATLSFFAYTQQQQARAEKELSTQRATITEKENLACQEFGKILNILATNSISTEKLKSANSELSEQLSAVALTLSYGELSSSYVYSRLLILSEIISNTPSSSALVKSERFLVFRSASFSKLIDTCGLG